MAGLARSAATSQPPRGIEGALSEVRDGEVLIERPDGSRITVIVNIRPFKNERGDVTGAINCLLRIAAQRGFEEPFLEFSTQSTADKRRAVPHGNVVSASSSTT